jgi:hypothetical protein
MRDLHLDVSVSAHVPRDIIIHCVAVWCPPPRRDRPRRAGVLLALRIQTRGVLLGAAHGGRRHSARWLLRPSEKVRLGRGLDKEQGGLGPRGSTTSTIDEKFATELGRTKSSAEYSVPNLIVPNILL